MVGNVNTFWRTFAISEKAMGSSFHEDVHLERNSACTYRNERCFEHLSHRKMEHILFPVLFLYTRICLELINREGANAPEMVCVHFFNCFYFFL
jgi:hypothetical protein